MIAAVAKWLCLSLAGAAFTLLAMLCAPVLPLFVRRDGYLPRWLWWFQTPDAPACGDAPFHANQMSWTTSNYLRTVFWLWRNPAYGFDFDVLGITIPALPAYKSSGDELTSNMPLHNGWVFRTVYIGGSRYFQFYLVHAWTDVKCLRVNLGWKLWGTLTAGQRRALVIHINPWIACSK